MANCYPSRRSLGICCAVTAAVILLLAVLLITLFFTLFKPKQPTIHPQPIILEAMDIELLPALRLNLTLGVAVDVKNPNYGRFRYGPSTTAVFYHDEQVGEGPVAAGVVPSRGMGKMNTTVEIHGEKIVMSEYFLQDLQAGVFNLTAESTVRGKVKLLFLKIHAEGSSICDISVVLAGFVIQSTCKIKISI